MFCSRSAFNFNYFLIQSRTGIDHYSFCGLEPNSREHRALIQPADSLVHASIQTPLYKLMKHIGTHTVVKLLIFSFLNAILDLYPLVPAVLQFQAVQYNQYMQYL